MTDEAHEQIRVDAPPARCFERRDRLRGVPDWAKDVKQATVLARRRPGRATRSSTAPPALGRRVRYVLDYDFADAPARVLVVARRGRHAAAARRAVRVRSATSDGTPVDYTCGVDLAIPLPGLVKRRAAGMIMGTALQRPQTSGGGGSTVSGPTPHPESVDLRCRRAPRSARSHLRRCSRASSPSCSSAVPEVRDHVLEAADALLDAAKALIDAADRVVRQQRGDA